MVTMETNTNQITPFKKRILLASLLIVALGLPSLPQALAAPDDIVGTFDIQESAGDIAADEVESDNDALEGVSDATIDNFMISESAATEQREALDEAFADVQVDTDSPGESQEIDLGSSVNLRLAAMADTAQQVAMLSSGAPVSTGDDAAMAETPQAEMMGSLEAVQTVMGDMSNHVFQGMSEETEAEFGGDVTQMEQNFQAMASTFENMMHGASEGSENSALAQESDFMGPEGDMIEASSDGFSSDMSRGDMPMMNMNDLGTMIGATMQGMSPEDFEQGMQTMMEMRATFLAQGSMMGFDSEMSHHEGGMEGTMMPGMEGAGMGGPMAMMAQVEGRTEMMTSMMSFGGGHGMLVDTDAGMEGVDHGSFDMASFDLGDMDLEAMANEYGVDLHEIAQAISEQIASEVTPEEAAVLTSQIINDVLAAYAANNSATTVVTNFDGLGAVNIHFTSTSHESHTQLNVTHVYPYVNGNEITSTNYQSQVQSATSSDITHIDAT